VERLDDRTVLSTFLVSSLADSGLGSLRQAILDANTASGDDIIDFSVTVPGTINLSSALPDLSTNIAIQGPGANLLTVRQGTWIYPNFYRIFTVDSGATVTLSGLTISNGWRTQGAGISNSGTLTVNNAAISGNWNGDNAIAGGIYNDGTLTLNSSTVSGNNGDEGGGIHNVGTLTLKDSTVSDNMYDGGIWNSGTATLNNSTISGNSAFFNGGGIENGGTLYAFDTVIAGDTGALGGVPSDLEGNIVSLGHNLIGNTSGGSGFASTDLLNTDPMLGPLQDNGGPTYTQALLPGSPAIDAGDNTNAPPTDQRGLPRIMDGNGDGTAEIDIGAYELQTPYTQSSTVTSLTASPNPSVFGQSVTFTATVSVVAPGTGIPTGTVTFEDGSTTLGTGMLNAGGVATFSTNTLGAGSHSITAVYGGDGNDLGSTSAAVGQVVNQTSTTTALKSSANPSVYGQSVTFTATVGAVAPGGGIPTGTVTFKDGGTTLGTSTLDTNGVATFSISTLRVASHSITAVYGGDGNDLDSTSAVVSQVINKASTAATLTSSVNPSVYGQSVTFTATVGAVAPGGGIPTGTVTFKDGLRTLGTLTLSGGVATVTTSTLSVGTHSITATYNGSTNYKTSTSATLSQKVIQRKAPIKLFSPATASQDGQTILGTVPLDTGGTSTTIATPLIGASGMPEPASRSQRSRKP
jgi:hypothetical protein